MLPGIGLGPAVLFHEVFGQLVDNCFDVPGVNMVSFRLGELVRIVKIRDFQIRIVGQIGFRFGDPSQLLHSEDYVVSSAAVAVPFGTVFQIPVFFMIQRFVCGRTFYDSGQCSTLYQIQFGYIFVEV